MLALDPDVIIVAPCGFDLARTRGEMHWLTDRPEFGCLKAVRTGRFFLADGNQFFNRPGPRIVETMEMIREMIDASAEFDAIPNIDPLRSGNKHRSFLSFRE